MGLARIADLIRLTMGEATAQDFIARVAFVVLTGNGDMHLKNWSLLYPNGRAPTLSPAYDFVSTVPYLPNDRMALNLAGTKEFAEVTLERFRRLADRAHLPEHETLDTVRRIVDGARGAWPKIRRESKLPEELAVRIDAHMRGVKL